MADHIFYSWQSDVEPGAACRSFIQGALEKAVDRIAKEATVEEAPRVDQDTKGVPGSVDIWQTILEKIDNSAVFVADLTLVGKTISGKPTPNPNVLVELGYALKRHNGWGKILMIMNTAIGGGSDLLPFDLKGKKVIMYSSPSAATERATEKKTLTDRLEVELRAMLADKQPPPAAPRELILSVDYEKKQGSTRDCHLYDLVITLKNTSKRRIDDWEVEFDLPTPLKDSTVYGIQVNDRSNERQTVFRVEGKKINQPLRPGEERKVRVGYRITNEVYSQRQNLFDEHIHAYAMVDGVVVEEVDRVVRDLQNF